MRRNKSVRKGKGEKLKIEEQKALSHLYYEAKYMGGKDEIKLETIDLSDEIEVKNWENWLSIYGNPDKMVYIGHHDFRPVYQFVFGECPLCGEMMRKAGEQFTAGGINVAFCCGSHKKGAKHKFIWSKAFSFPLYGANLAFLGTILKK